MMNPIIRLEIDGMKTSMMHMVSEKLLDLDADIKRLLDAELESGRIEEMLDKLVKEAVDASLRESVKVYFTYGAGRRTVKERAQKVLDEIFGLQAGEQNG